MSTIPLNNNDIAKSTQKFSFVNELFDKITNKDFINNSYSSFVNVDLQSHGERTTPYSNIYNALSAIGEDISQKIYSEILNYIDNVSNIDLCKVTALESMAKLLGISYNIFSNIDKIPLDLLNIIDILSINPTYIVNSDKFSSALRNYVSAEIMDSAPRSPSIISQSVEFSDTLYKSRLTPLISSIIYNDISTILNSTYAYPNAPQLYSSLSSSILLSSFQLPIDEQDKIEATKLKLRYNIPYTFDQIAEADNVYFGKTTYSDYSETQQELINLEFKRREKLRDPQFLESRYSYYSEKKFKDYYQFIEYEYTQSMQDISNDTYVQYDVDADYIMVNKPLSTPLLSVNKDNTIATINWDIVKDVVNRLTIMIVQICDIREQMKSQVQKNFMKGSFLLLEYIIKEYIHQLSQSENLSLDYSQIEVKLIEYNDVTQYCNISTDISVDIGDQTLNPQYWNTTAGQKISLPYDNNNLFVIPATVPADIKYMSEIDTQDFYLKTLNTKFNIGDKYSELDEQKQVLSSFLSTIYDCGADKMYLSDIDGEKLINYIDISGNLATIPLTGEVENALEEYKRTIFLTYSGQPEAYTPYYYIINSKHPSYQLHPYIRNFVEYLATQYPIQNIAKFVDNSISTTIIQNIDSYLDNNGYILSAWNIYSNSNADYLSKYELKSNINKLNQLDPVVGYPGLFYPDAIADFLRDSISFYSNLSSSPSNNRWYSGLNLPKAEYIQIAKTLEYEVNLLRYIAENTNNKFDIYKYGEDIFGTQYILIKSYSTQNPSEYTKHSTPGILFAKPQNYPIAVPAFICKSNNTIDEIYSLFSYTDTEYINTKFGDVVTFTLETNTKTFNFPAIYDFELSEDQQHIIFQALDKEKPILPVDIITQVDKIIDPIEKRTLYVLKYPVKKDIFGNIDSSGQNSISAKANYKHLKYVNIDGTLLSIYAHISSSSISFHVNTFSSTKISVSQYEESFSSINYLPSTISQCAFNITNDGNATLAYLVKDLTIALFKNYLDESFINTNNEFFEQFSTFVATQEFRFTISDVVKADNKVKLYNTHTQMGFIPILVGEKYNNEINNTIIIKEQHVEKIQILGPKAGEKSNGIDFKFTAPLRSYVNNADSYDDLEHIRFDKLSSSIYRPIKADEGYIEDKYVKNIDFVTTLYDYTLPEYIANANSNLELTANVAKFKIINDNSLSLCQLFNTRQSLTSDISLTELSVQWYKNSSGTIKLDFNSLYAKNAHEYSSLLSNYRNHYHLFLNLDEPGDAGYINVFSKYNSKFEQVQSYYIKNISDEYPKFMISAMYNVDISHDVSDQRMLYASNAGVLTIEMDNVIEYIEVE